MKDTYRYLKDGRPINETAREALLKRIESEGVTGQVMLDLLTVFDCSENEAQVALNISNTTWGNHTKLDKRGFHPLIKDAGLRIAIRRLLKDPELWRVEYIPQPDVDFIFQRYKEEGRKGCKASLLVGRAGHSIYRWRKSNPPQDHLKVLMVAIESALRKMDDAETAMKGKKELDEYMSVVAEEAEYFGVDIDTATTWPNPATETGD